MKTTLSFLSIALLNIATAEAQGYGYAGPQSGPACSDLKQKFPAQVLLPNVAEYTTINAGYYDQGGVLSPSCIFLPSHTRDVVVALKTLKRWNQKFAVKSGGHMPIPGFNNIDKGVLIAMDNMDTMEWAENDVVLKTGAGQRWENVLEKTAEKGRVAVGGRLGNVGVPGLLLGGGVSFLSNERGMACDNVKGYEVVLADGRIVYATEYTYRDLYRALRGGSSNLGIVTRFDLMTYDLPVGWGTTKVVPLNLRDAPLKGPAMDAAANYIVSGAELDKKTGVIITKANTPSAGVDVLVFSLWSSTPTTPRVYDEILSLHGQEVVNGTMPLGAYVKANGVTGAGPPMRNSFRTMAMLATKEGIRFAEETWAAAFKPLETMVGFTQISSYQPITKSQIMAGAARGGNVLGFGERVDQAPFVWIISGVSWTDPKDDALVFRTQEMALERIKAYAKQKGILDEFIYMNDAAGDQEVIRSYGVNNVRFLNIVKRTYDPAGIFTRLMPGGFKIPEGY